MSYRPPIKSTETFNVLARVSTTKKGEEKYYRVMFTHDNEQFDVYIKPENAPAYLIDPKTKRLATSEWRVKLSSDKTKMFSAVPSSAIVEVEFSDISHREGEEPAPYKKTVNSKARQNLLTKLPVQFPPFPFPKAVAQSAALAKSSQPIQSPALVR